MATVALGVPVMNNFKGLAELMRSVDIAVRPIIFDNWTNNVGVSKAWNYMLRESQDEDVLIICNDDIVFETDCLQVLRNAVWLDGADLATAVNTRDFPRREDCKTDEPDYACFAVQPQQFVEDFGYFDENFTPAYFEDNDMAYRIKLLGGRQIKLPSARMYHKGSQTQFYGQGPESEQRVVSHEQFRANQSYYTKKWGGFPGDELWDHPFCNQDFSPRNW
jgi:hypothetical protein